MAKFQNPGAFFLGTLVAQEQKFLKPLMPTPLKYNPTYHDDWAWSLAIKGATDQDIADAFHVSRRTIIRWRQTYPSFNTACQSGKEIADAKVKKSLFERAVGCLLYTSDAADE